MLLLAVGVFNRLYLSVDAGFMCVFLVGSSSFCYVNCNVQYL